MGSSSKCCKLVISYIPRDSLNAVASEPSQAVIAADCLYLSVNFKNRIPDAPSNPAIYINNISDCIKQNNTYIILQDKE